MPTALITGASSGLGCEFAKIMARKGHDLILVARNQQKLESYATELSKNFGIKCSILVADLSAANSAQLLFDQLSNDSIDVLINNAGQGICGPTAEYDISEMNRLIQLNITSLTVLTRLVLPQMLKRKRGKILNIGSIAGFQAGPWMNIYYASKAFVQSFGEALSIELTGTGVTVTTFCPGPTNTEFFERAKIKVPMFKKAFYAEPKNCAENGIAAMERGTTIALDGIKNYIIVFITRLLPRRIMRRLTGFITIRQI